MRWVCWWLLAGAAWADVSLYSTLPVTVRYEGREAGLGAMESTTLSCSDKAVEVTVVDEQGAEVFKGPLTNHRYWVLGPDRKLREAGFTSNLGRTPLKAVGFFNATGIPITVSLFAISGEERLEDVKVGVSEVVGPYELPEATFKVFLHDEGENPIGQAYSYAKPGRFYLIYRKSGTLYELEALGSTLPSKP